MAKETCRAVQSNLPGAKIEPGSWEIKQYPPRLPDILKDARHFLFARQAGSNEFWSRSKPQVWRLARQIFIGFAVIIFCVAAEVIQPSVKPEISSPNLIELQTDDGLWNGNWETTYGPLRLVQEGSRVYGDYHVRGVIEGQVSDDGSLLRGVFLYPDGRWGSFEFRRTGLSFDGHWRWNSMDDAGVEEWTGNRISPKTEKLVLAVDSELKKLNVLMANLAGVTNSNSSADGSPQFGLPQAGLIGQETAMASMFDLPK